uniref:Putative SGNH hydrolase-type esterase domain-containing protein n=1 Tax=Helianthus annuus TaxID=4232 RepID=A0A251U6D6_HELAN
MDEVRIRKTRGYFHDSIGRTNELCRIYSEACIKLCNETGIKVIDLWTAFQKQDDCDGIHFSSSGSKIVVKEILKVLNEAEWKPSLHWKSMPTEFSEDSPYYLVYLDGKPTLNLSDWTLHREIQWDEKHDRPHSFKQAHSTMTKTKLYVAITKNCTCGL